MHFVKKQNRRTYATWTRDCRYDYIASHCVHKQYLQVHALDCDSQRLVWWQNRAIKKQLAPTWQLSHFTAHSLQHMNSSICFLQPSPALPISGYYHSLQVQAAQLLQHQDPTMPSLWTKSLQSPLQLQEGKVCTKDTSGCKQSINKRLAKKDSLFCCITLPLMPSEGHQGLQQLVESKRIDDNVLTWCMRGLSSQVYSPACISSANCCCKACTTPISATSTGC